MMSCACIEAALRLVLSRHCEPMTPPYPNPHLVDLQRMADWLFLNPESLPQRIAAQALVLFYFLGLFPLSLNCL